MIIGLVVAAVVAGVIGFGVGLALGGGGGGKESKSSTEAQKGAEQPQLKFPGRANRPQPSVPLLGVVINAPIAPTATPLPAGVPTPTAAPAAVPPPAKTVPLYAHIETVTGGAGESKFQVDGNLACVKSGAFARGQRIVFRMEVVDTSTGKVLQTADVRTATVRLPNGEEVALRYGRHGNLETSPWFWVAVWDVPLDYPLGVLDYSVTVTTQDGKSITVKDPLASGSAFGDVRDEGTRETRVTIYPVSGS